MIKMEVHDHVKQVEQERNCYKAELAKFELDRAELDRVMRGYSGESKYSGMLWSHILRDLIQENSTLGDKVKELTSSGLAALASLVTERQRNKKMVGVLEECQKLFQNIKDYGAMGSPSDWEKVQYVWSLVNDVLATTKEKSNG